MTLRFDGKLKWDGNFTADDLKHDGFLWINSTQKYMELYPALVRCARKIMNDNSTPPDRLPIIAQLDSFMLSPRGVVFVHEDPDGNIDAFALGSVLRGAESSTFELLHMWIDSNSMDHLLRPGLGFLEYTAKEKLGCNKFIFSYICPNPEMVYENLYRRVGFDVTGYIMEKDL